MENTFQPPKFSNNVVGGKTMLNPKQTQNQIQILRTSRKSLGEYKNDQGQRVNLHNEINVKGAGQELNDDNIRKTNDRVENYDPLFDWNLKHGLLGKTNARFNEHFIHIDSSNRQKTPTMTVSQYFDLPQDPILTSELSNRIFVSHPNHTFNVGDKIVIDGVASISNKLYVTPTSTPITFDVGKNYMTITLPNGHGILETQSTHQQVSKLFIIISGFTNTGSTGNSLYYGNIPITFINNVHKFFLADSTLGITYDQNKMYVSLPYNYSNVPGTPTLLSSYVTISMLYVNGVQTNIINSKYPVDIYHVKSYQVIDETTTDGYYILLDSIALSSGNVGGSSVIIGKISDFTGGYTEPNQYKIPMEHILKNVVAVKIKSTEFPNSEYVVKNYPTSSQNNKLYWQNYEDGTYLYSIELSPGKYDPTKLISSIQTATYDVKRYLYPSVTQDYIDRNYIRVSIETETDTTTFNSYKEILMKRPFVGLYYIKNDSTADYVFHTVGTKVSDDPPVDQLYPLFIVIKFANHGLTLNTSYKTHESGSNFVSDGSVGDDVIISGTTTYMGIPGTTIDGTYEVYYPNLGLNLSATDYFMIMLQPFDIGQYKQRDIAQNGGIFTMYIPNIFRLLFDKPDTIGQLLGFPNVGETYAVTKYDKTITNKDEYEPDISPISVIDTTTPGDSIILSGNNYILMVCDELNVIETFSTIKSAFAKILLIGIPGKVCFNTFVDTPKIFYEPIAELSTLSLSFYSPNGNLYDFNGLDHSFTLAITTLDNLPDNTNINTHTGNRL